MPNPETTIPDVSPLVTIEGDDIVIRVSLDALVFATEEGPALEDFNDATSDYRKVKVTDKEAWRKEVVYALKREEENGDTLVHKMLDDALRYAVEQGADGIWIEGVSA